MQKKSEQLVLDLPHREALGRDDFLVTSSNAAAVELIDQWPNWPSHAAIILGSEGSGKTHLLEVWRQRSGAPLAIASDLVTTEIPILLKDGVAAIEDIHANNINERALFHVLNLAKQEGKHILITSRLTPGELALTIPDLASRLNSLPIVKILAPDDALLRGVLVKLFDDRQILVDESLVNYILVRMPRSLGTARRLVNEIDKLSLIEKSEITKPLVARVLSRLEAPGLFTTGQDTFT